MGRRYEGLASLGPGVHALGASEVAAAFGRAMGVTSKSRYGLDETRFAAIERLDVDEPGPEVRDWLAERVGGEEVLLVFAPDEAFRLPAVLLVERWRDMVCPSSDDAVVLPVGGGWALAYSHEDQFEFARAGLI